MFRTTLFCVVLALFLVSLAGCNKAASPDPAADDLLLRAQQAAVAEEMLWQNAPGGEARYADSLDELLAYDASLTDDPQITFQFDAVNEGYRFRVYRRANGPRVVCEPEAGCKVMKSEK
jgi:hypothetical protein